MNCAYPKTVNGAPLSVNRVPDVLTKPVGTGVETVVVDATVLVVLTVVVDATVLVVLTVLVGEAVDVPTVPVLVIVGDPVKVCVSGTHWKKKGLKTTQLFPEVHSGFIPHALEPRDEEREKDNHHSRVGPL